MATTKTGLVLIFLLIGWQCCVKADTPLPQPAALQEVEANDVIAYPVPASSWIHFAFRIEEDQPIRVRVFNSQYKLVREFLEENTGGKGQVSWDISNMPPGLYFYQLVINDHYQALKKLVIAR